MLAALVIVGQVESDFVNNDFETGDLTGWTVSEVGTATASVVKPSGDTFVCSLNVSGNYENGAYVQQSIDTRNAVSISFQYKIVASDGTSERFSLVIDKQDGTECGLVYAPDTSSTTDWITVNYTLDTGLPDCSLYNETTYFTFSVWGASGPGPVTVYLDEIHLIEPEPPEPPESSCAHLYWRLANDDTIPLSTHGGYFYEWQDYLFLITCPAGKIYQSSNGYDWSLYNSLAEPFDTSKNYGTSLGFPGNSRNTPLVISNGSYVWVIGGFYYENGNSSTTDVWRSNDGGLTWTRLTTNAWQESPPETSGITSTFLPAGYADNFGYGDEIFVYGVPGGEFGTLSQAFCSLDGGSTWMYYNIFNMSEDNIFYGCRYDIESFPHFFITDSSIEFATPNQLFDISLSDSNVPSLIYSNASVVNMSSGEQILVEWRDKIWMLGSDYEKYSLDNGTTFFLGRRFNDLGGDDRSNIAYSPKDSSHTEKIYAYDDSTGTNYAKIWMGAYYPQPEFLGYPLSGAAPLNVSFTDESENMCNEITGKSWLWTFGDGTTSTEQNPSHTYTSSGTYTVTLYTSNIDGVDSETKINYVTVENIQNVAIWGHVIDALTTTVISSATVSLKQAGFWHNTTSDVSGGYLFGDEFYIGLSIDALASKTGYTSFPILFTIWWPGTYEIDLYAIPEFDINETADAWIGGFVYDEFLAQGIPGATVNIWNGTWSDTNITNGAGFWYFTNLTNTTYNFNATAASYDNSLEYNATGVWGNFTQLDIPLSPNYQADITFRDSDTLNLIYSTISVVLTNATTGSILSTVNTTTSTWSSGLMDYGLYNITASCEGYHPGEATIYLFENVTGTVYLDPISEFDGANTNYVPHPVRWTYVDAYGNPIVGATVTATALESTSPWDWLSGVFGYDTSAVDIQNTVLSGTTGHDGTLSFLMVETVQYRVHCTKPTAGIDHSVDIYPKESEYFIRIGSLPLVGSYPTYSLNATTIGGNVILFGNYTDTSGSSSGVRFIVRNSTSEVYNTSVTLTGGSGSASYAVNNTRGDQYTFGITAEHTTHGTIQKWIDITLKGTGRMIDFGSGWTDFMYLAMSLAGIFLVAGCFGEIDVRMGAIFIPITAGIFWTIGWMGEVYGPLITIAGVLGALYYMRSKAKELDT